MNTLKKLLIRMLVVPVVWIAHRAITLAGTETLAQPPPTAGPSPVPDALPPFNGSPEEAAVLLTMPPVCSVKQRRLADISRSPSLPEAVEEMTLSSLGKGIARTEFLTMDGRGVIAPAGQLKGRCNTCWCNSFDGAPCGACGLFNCSCCLVPIERPEGALRLCPVCERAWQWNKSNWE